MFGQGRIALRHLIHGGDALIDLFDAARLFLTARRQLGHDVAGPLDGGDDFLQGLARLIDQPVAFLDLCLLYTSRCV